MEELEEGEIVENDHQLKEDEGRHRQATVSTPSKKGKAANGGSGSSSSSNNHKSNGVHQPGPSTDLANGQRELEEGELVSSDEEEDKETAPAVSSSSNHSKEKRGVENKENQVDKKNKKGPKPRWVPLDIEPASVRPKSAQNNKTKSARSPKDVSNSTQDGRRSAGKGMSIFLAIF